MDLSYFLRQYPHLSSLHDELRENSEGIIQHPEIAEVFLVFFMRRPEAFHGPPNRLLDVDEKTLRTCIAVLPAVTYQPFERAKMAVLITPYVVQAFRTIYSKNARRPLNLERLLFEVAHPNMNALALMKTVSRLMIATDCLAKAHSSSTRP